MTRSELKELLKENGVESPSKALLDDLYAMYNQGLNAEKEKYKNHVSKEEYDRVKSELDTLKAKGNVPEDYESLKQFKADTEKKEIQAKKNDAVIKLLKDNKASDKALSLLVKAVDFEKIEIAEDGSIKDSEKIIKSMKAEYGDFFVVDAGAKGAKPKQKSNNNNPGSVTKEQFKKMSLAQRSELARTQPEVYQTLRGE